MHCWPRCACIPSFITTLLMHDVVRHGWMRARTWGAHAPCVARVAARGRGRANPVVGILSRACLRVVCFKRMRSGRPEPSSIKSFVTREHRQLGRAQRREEPGIPFASPVWIRDRTCTGSAGVGKVDHAMRSLALGDGCGREAGD